MVNVKALELEEYERALKKLSRGDKTVFRTCQGIAMLLPPIDWQVQAREPQLVFAMAHRTATHAGPLAARLTSGQRSGTRNSTEKEQHTLPRMNRCSDSQQSERGSRNELSCCPR